MSKARARACYINELQLIIANISWMQSPLIILAKYLAVDCTLIMHLSLQVCENHPQGVVLVRFKDRQDARKCIELMNGRW